MCNIEYKNLYVSFFWQSTDMSQIEACEVTAQRTVQLYMLGFAKKVWNKVTELAGKYCYGCEVDHPSQTQHSCLMWTDLEHFYMYRKEAFESVLQNDSITVWMDNVCSSDIAYEAKYVFLGLLLDKKVVPKEEKIFDMVECMIKLEDRFTLQ